jgi:hypothetical protein
VFRDSGTGDWKVARTRRLESLRYSIAAAPVQGFNARFYFRGILSPRERAGVRGNAAWHVQDLSIYR